MTRPTLNDTHIDRAMTNISIAYMNSEYIAGQVFPRVTVNNKSDLYFVFDESSFFRRRAGPRAPRTRSPRADYALTTASYNCLSYALAYEIADEVRRNADAPLRPDINATQFVTDALMLDQEIRVAYLTTAASENSGTAASDLWVYAASPTTQWSASNSDPFGDIQTAQSNVISNIGRKPNVAVMSWDVWRWLKIHPDFVSRVQYTRPGGTPQPEDLRTFFDVDKWLIGHSIYDTSKEGQSASKGYVWGDGFWLGYVPTAPALEEPAAGYCLQWGNRAVRRFRDDQARMDVVDAEEFSAEIVSSSVAGALLFDTV